MKKWTFSTSIEGQFTLKISHGGKPFWCKFDYVVVPLSDVEQVRIEVSKTADDVTVKWFPHVLRGMIRGLENSRKHGNDHIGIKIQITKIYATEIHSSEWGCEYYGAAFIYELRHFEHAVVQQ